MVLRTLINKELSPSVSIDDKREIIINSMNLLGKSISVENQNIIDNLLIYILHLETLLRSNENLINEELATVFLNIFYPKSEEIISYLPNFDMLIKFGSFSRKCFIKWLKKGFIIHQQTDKNFLIKCSELYNDDIFQITEDFFEQSQKKKISSKKSTELKRFEISINPEILLKFTEEQINKLYELNPSLLGKIFGRLLRILKAESSFPEALKILIIKHGNEPKFKNSIFQEYSSGVRGFSGNNYDQQFSEDYKKIIHWREEAVDNAVKIWLQEFHQYIDSLREQSQDLWRELEVE